MSEKSLTTQTTKKKTRLSKGFSLAEVSIAMAVLGIATIGLVGWQINEYKHAKAKEIASTLQAIDAGLYQVSSMLGYIPTTSYSIQSTSPTSDTIYGCILRNTDSWKGLMSNGGGGGGGNNDINGIRLGDKVWWFRSWNDVVTKFNPPTWVWLSNSYIWRYDKGGNFQLQSVYWPYITRIIPNYTKNECYWNCMEVCYTDSDGYRCEKRCDYDCNPITYTAAFQYGWNNRMTPWKVEPIVHGYPTNGHCGFLFFSVETNHKGTDHPILIYIDCAGGGENPPPNLSSPSNPNNGFNPVSLLPSNLLDPRIDLRKLAEQGYRISFRPGGHNPKLYDVVVTGLTSAETSALQSMLGGIVSGNSFTYRLNKGRGYSLRYVNNFNCQ